MFTSVAIAQLVERGDLSFDVPIGRYLRDFPNAGIASKVTIDHLLTHRSGIPDLPDNLFNAPPARLQGYLPFFAETVLESAPGATRAYSNAGFILLGLIIEEVTQTSYEDYVRRNVFASANMSNVGFGAADRQRWDVAIGYSRGAGGEWVSNTAVVAAHAGPHGGAVLTAIDLVRFFDALRKGRLVRPETADLITTRRDGASAPYGFGELLFDTDRLVGHSGGNAGVSADAYTYWKSGYTIVVLSNLAPPASHDVAGGIRKLIEPRFRSTTASP